MKYKFTIPLAIEVMVETDKDPEQAYKIARREAKRNLIQHEYTRFSGGDEYTQIKMSNYRVAKENKQ